MLLNICLEVALIAIIVYGSRYGYNKGLFKMTAGPARLIISLMLSFCYSGFIGSYIVEPIILYVLKDKIGPLIELIINPLSTAIAFSLLFFFFKIIISFVISLGNRILDKGVVGTINKSLGSVFAGAIAFLLSTCFASFSEYLLTMESFSDSTILEGFSGGPIYRAFLSISPLRLYIN